MILPKPNSVLAATTAGGHVYAIGGFGAGGYGTTVVMYNPKTNKWASAPPLPQGRDNLDAVTGADGRIYAFGGCCYGNQYLSSMEIYDVKAHTWITGTSLPAARINMGAAVGPDGRIYAIGGFSFFGDTRTTYVYGPSATFSPVKGKVGAQINIAGGGFAANTTVSLYWKSRGASGPPAPRTRGATSSPPLSFTVPPGATKGTHKVVLLDNVSLYPCTEGSLLPGDVGCRASPPPAITPFAFRPSPGRAAPSPGAPRGPEGPTRVDTPTGL